MSTFPTNPADCDPNTDQLADWTVQTGHVEWETQ